MLEGRQDLEGSAINDLPPAAPRCDRSAEDIGDIVEFGHLNIRVPDQRQAVRFYPMGLGLTRDAHLVTGVDNAWINVGACQFHLPVGSLQLLRGTTGLVMPDLDALTARLARIEPRLPGTRFCFHRSGPQLCVTCPGATTFGCTRPTRRVSAA